MNLLSFRLNLSILLGVVFVALISIVATLISFLPPVKSLGFSGLVIGIMLGIIYANINFLKIPTSWQEGVNFSAKKILRLAIILYGFRITFQEIASIGMDGFLVSLIMLSSTFLIGSFVGIKLFKMDADTSFLNASGASVCGAAAVLATESVLKPQEHKTAIAVSMVVLFGTVSMFLYPLLYTTIIQNATGFFYMAPEEFGIYVGASVHEVAQVIAIPFAIPNHSEEMANSAVIVKMTRVMMIAPLLIVLGLYLSYSNPENKLKKKIKLSIPWFAVYFIVVAGFNSLHLVPKNIVYSINMLDTFLLTMAMVALGMGTKFSSFKTVGVAPFFTSFVMFIWLIVGGFVVTKLVCL